MANLLPVDTTPLSRLITSLHVTDAGHQRIRALVDQWREGRDTVAEIRSILVRAAEWTAGERPEDDRAAVRWERSFDNTCDDIDRVLTRLTRPAKEAA